MNTFGRLDRRKNKLTYKTVEGYKTNLRRVDKYFKDKNILLEELTMRVYKNFTNTVKMY